MIPVPGVTLWQLPTPGLGDNSYLLRSGEAVAVVDPQRDLDRFEAALAALGGRLVAVVETHVHNDYVSGGPALAAAHGAPYLVPAAADYTLAHRPLAEGDEVEVGAVRLRALATPGHTAHHTSYAVVAGGAPVALLTGGCVLVGALGRTDLISPEATEGLTRQQWRSARRLLALAPAVAIGPTHGRGSFCAASSGGDQTWTTVGEERQRNPALLITDEAAFVAQQLAGLPAYPAYYRQMAPRNRAGQPGWVPGPVPSLQPAAVEALQRAGGVIVDVRPRRAFAAGHLPGAVSLGLDDDFATYLGWLFPLDTRLVLVLEEGQDATLACRQAARIGIETIVGTLQGGAEAWARSGRPLRRYPVISFDELSRLRGDGAAVLDVRQDGEWDAGHIPGARHIHVPDLPARLGELGPGRDGAPPVHVHCAKGYRASLAASLLDGAGIPVVAVDGAFEEWAAGGHPVSRGAER